MGVSRFQAVMDNLPTPPPLPLSTRDQYTGQQFFADKIEMTPQNAGDALAAARGDDVAIESEVQCTGDEPSVESLLGSLMRALNTEQGRADFGRMVATGVSSPL